jgi:hypothetical protein
MRLRLLHTAISTFALAGGFCAPLARAADLPLPSPSQPIEKVIDQQIDAAISEAGVTPADQADDATVIRRLTLDLVGRIPTSGEVDAYTKSTESDKRTKLVDRLIASPGFARHQAAQFDVMVNPDTNMRGNGAFREYLVASLKENKPWDKLFREVLLPNEGDAKLKGAADFLRNRIADTDKLTNDVSVAFFGVNVSCAQCHNHPLVMSWTQDHFYGMKMFLARTFDNGGFLGERGYGTIKYKPAKGPERTAKMMFLTGAAVEDSGLKEPTAEEMKKEKESLDKAKAAKTPPPAPKYSARGKLVEVALQEANATFFARNIVNRMWHRFFGSGLVNPLDQMHSENPPSHPELLSWLARDLAGHDYDLKRLIRGLVLSKAYSRGSRYDSDQPDPKLFAVARLKPMTPLQLTTSLKIAATDPATFEGKKTEEFEKAIEQIENAGRGFAGLIAQPTDNFQIGVGEALLFSNGNRVLTEMLTDGGGTILGKLKTIKDPKEAVEVLIKTAYGRAATAEESKALVAYIQKRAGREAEAYKQVLWALVTAPEFRFSY